LLRDIHTLRDAATKLSLLIVAHTFVRASELREATWGEIDLENAQWVIPAKRMKNGKIHFVPLSLQVVKMFKEVAVYTQTDPNDKRHENTYVMRAYYHRNKPLSDGTMMSALKRDLPYKGRMSVHGFRHLATTILNESGLFRSDAIERQMSHSPVERIRAIYNHAQYISERKAMMQWYSDWLDAQLNKNVTPN
jgi:integrase